MPTIKHFAVIAGYALVAILAAYFITLREPSLGAQLSAGVGVFAVVAVIHHFFTKNARELELKRHIDTLYTSHDKLNRDFRVLKDENKALVASLSELADFAFGDVRKFPQAQAELKTLRSMKGEAVAAVETAAPVAEPAPVPERARVPMPPPTAGQKAATHFKFDSKQVFHVLRDALKHQRVDLFLQPIVKLPQRTPRYYECFSRIRAADGTIVTPDQYLELARDHGMLRSIDNMLLFRCIQLVRKAQRRNHNLGFLCNISMETLGDREFFQQFIGFMTENRDLASRLVFEVAQADIDAHWDSFAGDLGKLARLGFRFSMDHVTHLSLDMEQMASRNFSLVKVSASTLLKHAGNGGRHLRAFREELRRNRLELIVEKVETEEQLLDLLDLDMPLAQGFLFCQTRLCSDD